MCAFCFFFKRKTAYEMRISDWSSDVCSSDLALAGPAAATALVGARQRRQGRSGMPATDRPADSDRPRRPAGRRLPEPERVGVLGHRNRRGQARPDRKGGVSGKRESVSVDLGGRRNIRKKKQDW